jgi:hypothetical protein
VTPSFAVLYPAAKGKSLAATKKATTLQLSRPSEWKEQMKQLYLAA